MHFCLHHVTAFFDLTISAFGPDLLKWGLDGNLFLWSLWPPQVSKLPRLSLFFSPPSSSLWSGQSEWFPGSGADQYGPEHHELGGPQGSRRGQRGRTQAQSHPAQPGLLQRLLPHPPVCGWVNREASTSTALILFHSLQQILRPDTHWYHSGSPHTHTHTKLGHTPFYLHSIYGSSCSFSSSPLLITFCYHLQAPSSISSIYNGASRGGKAPKNRDPLILPFAS